MANVFSIVYFVVGVVLMHTCLFVWTAIMLPQPVDRARHRLETRPIASLLWGILLCAAMAGLFWVVLHWRMVGIRLISDMLDNVSKTLAINRVSNDAYIITHALGWMLAGPLLAGAIIGGASMSKIFAARAQQQMQRNSPLLALVTGAFCTSASCFLPFVGWFVFLPLVGLMSIGAGVLGLFNRRGVSPSHAV